MSPLSHSATLPPGTTEADLRITHLRGPVLVQVRRHILEREGQEGWERLLSRVSPECRAVMDGHLGIFEWVEVRFPMELSEAYLAVASPDFAHHRGRDAAREHLLGRHSWILRQVGPGFLLTNLPRIHRFYYRGGIVTLDSQADHGAMASFWASGLYPELFSQSVVGWLEQALELVGVTGGVVRYVPPNGEGLEAFRHRYYLTWE